MRQICTLSVLYLYFICTLSSVHRTLSSVHRTLSARTSGSITTSLWASSGTIPDYILRCLGHSNGNLSRGELPVYFSLYGRTLSYFVLLYHTRRVLYLTIPRTLSYAHVLSKCVHRTLSSVHRTLSCVRSAYIGRTSGTADVRIPPLKASSCAWLACRTRVKYTYVRIPTFVG